MPDPSDNRQRNFRNRGSEGEMRRAGSPAIRQATRPTSADAEGRHGEPALPDQDQTNDFAVIQRTSSFELLPTVKATHVEASDLEAAALEPVRRGFDSPGAFGRGSSSLLTCIGTSGSTITAETVRA